MTDPRVVLVTGASSGIGRAVAVAFGALGWSVGLGARGDERRDTAADAVRDAGGRACSTPLDVTDPTSVDAWFDTCEAALGPVDALVSNAGIAIPGTIGEVDVDAHRRVLDTDLWGALLVARRGIRSMRGRPGDLVFMSSDVTRNPRPQLASYAAAKAGVEQLARTLSLELEGTGVRSTIVRVGPTVTEFASEWDPSGFADLMQTWKRFGLTRRQGLLSPEEVAEAVVRVVTLPPGIHAPEIDLHATEPH